MVDDGRRTDGRRTDGRTTEHGYTISSPCEPDGSGELKSVAISKMNKPLWAKIVFIRSSSKTDDKNKCHLIVMSVIRFYIPVNNVSAMLRQSFWY